MANGLTLSQNEIYKQHHKILRFVYNDERVLMPKA